MAQVLTVRAACGAVLLSLQVQTAAPPFRATGWRWMEQVGVRKVQGGAAAPRDGFSLNRNRKVRTVPVFKAFRGRLLVTLDTKHIPSKMFNCLTPDVAV